MQHHDFTKFQVLKPRLLEVVDKMLAEDIARLMALIPQEDDYKTTNSNETNIDNIAVQGNTKSKKLIILFYLFLSY